MTQQQDCSPHRAVRPVRTAESCRRRRPMQGRIRRSQRQAASTTSHDARAAIPWMDDPANSRQVIIMSDHSLLCNFLHLRIFSQSYTWTQSHELVDDDWQKLSNIWCSITIAFKWKQQEICLNYFRSYRHIEHRTHMWVSHSSSTQQPSSTW